MPGSPAAASESRRRWGRWERSGTARSASTSRRPDSPAYERARLAAVSDAVRRARSYAAAFGAELTALLEVSDPGIAGSGVRVAGGMAALSFEAGDLALDVTPMRSEVRGAVEVRFAMSEPEQEVFRG